VLIAMLLALGWTWTSYLKDLHLVDDTQRTWILLGITALLTLQQIYNVIPKPVSRGVVEARRAIIQKYLWDFHAEYYAVLKRLHHNKNKSFPTVRVNVMLPTKRLKGLFGTYLKIYYYVCPQGVIYSDQELALGWGRDQGTSGWAWQHKDISISDSAKADFRIPENRLTRKQISVMKGINSTLSIPIWYNNSVIGVLNLDSKQTVADTLFDNDNVYTLASACAKVISGLCFDDGVEA